MQSVAQHLACGNNQNRCADWFNAAREMLRGALHDQYLFYRYQGISLIVKSRPLSSRYHVTNGTDWVGNQSLFTGHLFLPA